MSTHTITWTISTNPSPECDQHGAGVNQHDCAQHTVDVATCRLLDHEGTELDQDGFASDKVPDFTDDKPFTEMENALLAKHGISRSDVTVEETL